MSLIILRELEKVSTLHFRGMHVNLSPTDSSIEFNSEDLYPFVNAIWKQLHKNLKCKLMTCTWELIIHEEWLHPSSLSWTRSEWVAEHNFSPYEVEDANPSRVT